MLNRVVTDSNLYDTAAVPHRERAPAPDFVVIDVETACSRVSSICQVGIVGFRDGRECFAFETLVDPRDIFRDFTTRIHGIAAHHVVDKPCFADIHGAMSEPPIRHDQSVQPPLFL